MAFIVAAKWQRCLKVPRTAGQSTRVTCDLFVLEFLQDREYDEWIQGMRPYVSEQFPCDTTGI